MENSGKENCGTGNVGPLGDDGDTVVDVCKGDRVSEEYRGERLEGEKLERRMKRLQAVQKYRLRKREQNPAMFEKERFEYLGAVARDGMGKFVRGGYQDMEKTLVMDDQAKQDLEELKKGNKFVAPPLEMVELVKQLQRTTILPGQVPFYDEPDTPNEIDLCQDSVVLDEDGIEIVQVDVLEETLGGRIHTTESVGYVQFDNFFEQDELDDDDSNM